MENCLIVIAPTLSKWRICVSLDSVLHWVCLWVLKPQKSVKNLVFEYLLSPEYEAKIISLAPKVTCLFLLALCSLPVIKYPNEYWWVIETQGITKQVENTCQLSVMKGQDTLKHPQPTNSEVTPAPILVFSNEVDGFWNYKINSYINMSPVDSSKLWKHQPLICQHLVYENTCWSIWVCGANAANIASRLHFCKARRNSNKRKCTNSKLHKEADD